MGQDAPKAKSGQRGAGHAEDQAASGGPCSPAAAASAVRGGRADDRDARGLPRRRPCRRPNCLPAATASEQPLPPSCS